MKRKFTAAARSRRPFPWVVAAALVFAVGVVGTVLALKASSGPTVRAPRVASLAHGIAFVDLESQMREFIGYESSIQLTAAQEAVKKDALERRQAVCCDDYTAYTCCCSCNLSKSLWGLSNYLIAVKGMDANQVAEATSRWIEFAGPGGFTGDACYTGGCGRAPHANGCGGMAEGDLVV
jgi:hypothetical protein